MLVRPRVLAAIATVLVALSAFAQTASARPSEAGFPCGRVTAFTPPTATTAGSIAIGTTTFVAEPGSLPNPPPPISVGSVVCLTGTLNAAGAFTSLTASTLGDQTVCGQVVGSTPATATTPGSLTLVTNTTWTLSVGPGVTLTSAQTSGMQCFKFDVNAQGNAEVTAAAGAPPAQATRPPAAASTLPSTSADRSPTDSTLAVVLLALASGSALLFWLMRRRARTMH